MSGGQYAGERFIADRLLSEAGAHVAPTKQGFIEPDSFVFADLKLTVGKS